MYERTLSGSQGLNLTISSEEVLIKELHQLIGRVIFYGPETHCQRICSSSQERPSQTQLFVSPPLKASPVSQPLKVTSSHPFRFRLKASIALNHPSARRIEEKLGASSLLWP